MAPLFEAGIQEWREQPSKKIAELQRKLMKCIFLWTYIFTSIEFAAVG